MGKRVSCYTVLPTSVSLARLGRTELLIVVRAALRVVGDVASVGLLALGSPHVLHGEGAAGEAVVVGEGEAGRAYRFGGRRADCTNENIVLL